MQIQYAAKRVDAVIGFANSYEVIEDAKMMWRKFSPIVET